MRCRHCGTRFSKAETVPPFRASCPKCARIVAPFLVTKQGDSITGFREIMSRQNNGDPRRKLLETQSFRFVVFIDDEERIVGFDLEDRDSAHLFQWRQGHQPVFYGVANVGRGYHNRDEVYVNGRFSAAAVATELTACGDNIRRDVRDILLEGINAYISKDK